MAYLLNCLLIFLVGSYTAIGCRRSAFSILRMKFKVNFRQPIADSRSIFKAYNKEKTHLLTSGHA